MSKNKKKFNQIWSSQTDLGKKFGLSAIAVGKLLIEAGLKDAVTKSATEKALKDGTPYFMWNIEKIRPLIAKDHQPLSTIEYWVREVLDIYKEAQKSDDEGNKFAYLMLDGMYDDVPKDIREEVRAKVEQIVGESTTSD